MKTLPPCARPEQILSFDFDGTLHDPSAEEPVPLLFFEEIRRLRNDYGAVWGINTGRSLPQVLEGLREGSFPFLPDWVVSREREIHFTNPFGRFQSYDKWNQRCQKDIEKLFKKSAKTLKLIRKEIEEHTGAQYIEMEGEPAGLISRTEEEMEWIVERITPMVKDVAHLGWQRNSIYLRFGHLQYQKGSALAEVTRIYGLARDQAFAAGDSHNDLEMLSSEYSGKAACPANAVSAVKECIVQRQGLLTKLSHGEGIVEALRFFYP